MSRFANPYDGGAAGAGAYVRAMRARLGERDPLAVLAEGPDELARRLDVAEPRALGHSPPGGGWSVGEVALHLADTEIVYAFRYRAVVGQEIPETPGFDQERWVAVRRQAPPAPPECLALFTTLRHANLGLLRTLEPAAWEREGRHERRGRESLRQIVALAAAHDLVHLDQIDRTLDLLRAAD